MMADKAPERANTAAWRVLLALVCVLLVIVVGAAQAVHMHADGTDTHANCSLCAAAHTSIQTAPTPAPAHTFPVAAMPDARQDDPPSGPLSTFALFTRPPPAA